MPTSLQIFQAGKRTEAVSTVREWIRDNAKGYLKIYDPYLVADDLDILSDVDPECQIFVFTSWKAQKGFSPGDKAVRQVYQRKWELIFASPRPTLQMLILGTKSGDSPVHSRYIISEDRGLGLGTSISGLGLKDTDIRELGAGDAAKIETEFVDPLLVPQLALYKGEQLLRLPFMIE